MNGEKRARIDQALSLENLKLPAEAPIEHLEWREITDSVGDDALWVTVVLADSLAENDRFLEYVVPIQQRIYTAIREADIEEFPYPRILLARDWREDQQEAA